VDDQPTNWWIRGYLWFAALQGLGIGLTGLVLPAEMQIPLRLSPLNARFVAALYIAGAVGVVLAALARRRADARLFVVGFGTVTLLILILTVVHWGDFLADDLPHRPIWVFDYVVDPVVAMILVPVFGLWPPRPGRRHSRTPLLVAEAVAFGLLGGLLVLAPDLAVAVWPWALPPVAGQLYGCFFLTFAIGAVLAARETSDVAIRDFLIASLVLAGLILLVSIVHVDRFKMEPVTIVWFGAFALAAGAFGTGLRRRPA
jgi:hypothetical protein